MATKLLAKPVVDEIFKRNQPLFDALKAKPTGNYRFLIITTGKDPASLTYIRQKIKLARKVGIETKVLDLSTDPLPEITTEALVDYIKNFDAPTMVQLPWLDNQVDLKAIIETIPDKYDVDGMKSNVWGRLVTQAVTDNSLHPATPKGILLLLDYYVKQRAIPQLNGLNAVVIGRSHIVGRPVAEMLINRNCTVTVCHSHTSKDSLKRYLKNADLVVSAAGQPQLFNVSDLRDNTIVIDASFNRLDGKLCGDFDTTGVENTNIAYTPVPGGVGPMTVASLITTVANNEIPF